MLVNIKSKMEEKVKMKTTVIEINQKRSFYHLILLFKLFLEEQKECPKGTRGTDDLLYIDQYILKEVKTRWKNVAMSWIDYKKLYDLYGPANLDNRMCKNVKNIQQI